MTEGDKGETMEATLDAIRRRPVQGEETEIASDLACEIDTDARRVVIHGDRDLGVKVGDELEAEALERKVAVRSVRRELTEDGYRITLEYR